MVLKISWRISATVRYLELLVVKVFLLETVDQSYRIIVRRRNRVMKITTELPHHITVGIGVRMTIEGYVIEV
jgi:hypothetical protein